MSTGVMALGVSPIVIGLLIIGLFKPVVPCCTFIPPELLCTNDPGPGSGCAAAGGDVRLADPCLRSLGGGGLCGTVDFTGGCSGFGSGGWVD